MGAQKRKSVSGAQVYTAKNQNASSFNMRRKYNYPHASNRGIDKFVHGLIRAAALGKTGAMESPLIHRPSFHSCLGHEILLAQILKILASSKIVSRSHPYSEKTGSEAALDSTVRFRRTNEEPFPNVSRENVFRFHPVSNFVSSRFQFPPI
jgi:hypothetical protein